MNRKEREERENLHFKYNPNHSPADGRFTSRGGASPADLSNSFVSDDELRAELARRRGATPEARADACSLITHLRNNVDLTGKPGAGDSDRGHTSTVNRMDNWFGERGLTASERFSLPTGWSSVLSWIPSPAHVDLRRQVQEHLRQRALRIQRSR